MTLIVRLLGQVQISRDDQPISVRGSKPVALLAYLLVTGKTHPRQHLMDLLFDGPDDPKASLRWTLSELRQAIGADYVLADRQQIAFNFECDYWLDVTAFESGQTDLYRGDFLAGLNLRHAFGFEEWTLFERERLRGVYQLALTRHLENSESSGANQAVIETAHQLLRLDNLREEGYRALMRVYARQGQRQAALAQFDLCCQVLKTELGVEPAAETIALAEAIRQGIMKSTAALPSVPPHNLPPQPTPFIGREEELAEIAQRLTLPACRLLTLVGPGGIGKTRLALEGATRLLSSEVFPGGIYFVPLASLSSSDFLVTAIAGSLNFSFQSGEDPKIQLLNFLSNAKSAMLLVLDNFEHFLTPQEEEEQGGTDLALDILQVAPMVKLLVTSRERLNLREEWLLDILGLRFPISLQPGEGLEGYSAVQLFLQTATRLQATFTLSEADKPFVARICQQVEGMPLGLELAAAWVRILSCEEIVQEIEKNLDFLTMSLRDMPARHRSLRAVFDPSWNLLSAEERGVFRKLSIFRGGFQKEAAELVAGASLPLLSALVDKSFLRRDIAGRYEVHDLLRQYGGEKLRETGEAERLRDRHLMFFLKWAEEAGSNLQGAEQVRWLEILDVENDNLRAALAWSLESGETEAGLRLAEALGQFWFTHGHLFNEGQDWLERLLSQPEAPGQMGVRARGFLWLGRLVYTSGDLAVARSSFEKSLALYRQLGDKDGMAESLYFLGEIAASQHDEMAARSFYAAARLAYQESLISLRELGDKWRLAHSLIFLGEIARIEGDYAAARPFYTESLAIGRELNDGRGIAVSLFNLGLVAHSQGDYRQATTFFEESLTLVQQHGNKRDILACLAALAGVAGGTEQPERAMRLFGAVESLHEAFGIYMEHADRIEYDHNVAVVRAQLTEAAFIAAWTGGQVMTLEQAVAYALAAEPDYSV